MGGSPALWIRASAAFAFAVLTVGLFLPAPAPAQPAGDRDATAESPVEVWLDRRTHRAGAGEPIRVTVAFRAGARPEGASPPELVPDRGSASGASLVSEGRYRAFWHPPDAFHGAAAATLTVRVVLEGGVEATASAAIELEPGPPAEILVNAERSRLRADGRDATRIRVAVIDAFGNPVPAAAAAFEASALGSVTSFSPLSSGGLVATYVAPARALGGVDRVVIRHAATGVESAVELALEPPEVRHFFADVRGGYQTNLGVIASPLLAADLGVRLPVLSRRLLVALAVGHYRSTERTFAMGGVDGLEPVEVSARVTPLLLRAAVALDAGPVGVRLGGGAGLLLAETAIRSPTSGTRERSAPHAAVCAFAGLTRALGPGFALVEAGYAWSPSAHRGLGGNLGGLQLSGGYGVEF